MLRRILPLLIASLALTAGTAFAQGTTTSAPPAPSPLPGATLDETVPPGANYEKAEFRFWLPANVTTVRAIVVLVPGSNGDGRPMAADVFWQDFATKQQLALVACRFTDKPHDQSFIEDYVNVSRGSGQALLDVIAKFAESSKHPEVTRAPLLLWGMSAGGQFNYEFVAWKPERVAAFIVNKGGIYYSALLSKAAREVPGFLFVGEKDCSRASRQSPASLPSTGAAAPYGRSSSNPAPGTSSGSRATSAHCCSRRP